MFSLLLPLLGVLTLSTGRPTIHVEPSQVHRGHVVRVFGSVPGCRAPDEVSLLSGAFSHAKDFAGVPVVYARVGKGSRYSIEARIPATRRPGRYLVTGRCGGGNLGVQATLHVLR
jgi:hypothetical protein